MTALSSLGYGTIVRPDCPSSITLAGRIQSDVTWEIPSPFRSRRNAPALRRKKNHCALCDSAQTCSSKPVQTTAPEF